MKKLFLILGVGLTLAVNADILYWMVDTPDVAGKTISNESTTFSWNYAILTIQDNDILYSGSSSGGTKLTYEDAVILDGAGAYAYADIGESYSGKYFLIELFSSDDQWIAGYSKAANASDVASFIRRSSMSVPPAAGFGQGATYAVPEPTSGLLFLIGGMLLGLKRRRQQV